ncbi:DeoR/GlpR family DNA-binding transcription regulator [Cupriavidus sp. 30B13]|uniref:DeoR/GlpR family DNA-binding transcription regulator n=1 Tax=Cupriavidus sp. 30B13 TaxID=3384241 RepID=UPI003B8F4730
MELSRRQREILDWLHEVDRLSTEQLADRFNVSSQTIRRDINDLDEQGLVRRVHGGLSLPKNQHNKSFLQRSNVQIERKRRIAQAAVGLMQDDATIFLGYGTTVAEFARALPPDRPLRVVTNNIDAVRALADKPGIETWVAGGKLRPADRDVMGSITLDFLRRFRAHFAICGVGGVSADGTLYEFQPDEAELSQVLLTHSHRRLLLADSSKFLREAPCRVAGLEQVDHFFTDADASAELQALCERAGVETHLC